MACERVKPTYYTYLSEILLEQDNKINRAVTTLVFETRRGQKIISSPNRPEHFLGLTHHLIQWVLGFFTEGKAAGACS